MRLLGIRPRPFTAEDVVAAGLLKSFGLAQWSDEATLYRASQRLSPEMLAALLPRVPPDAPAVAPLFRAAAGNAATREAALPRSAGSDVLPEVLLDGLASLREIGMVLPRAGGSNAWAVSGKKSAT